MYSLFVYKMLVMIDLTEGQKKEINTCISNFLWSGKRAKISKDVLCCNKNDGSLKLVDLNQKQKSLKIWWIFRIQEDPVIYESCISRLSPVLGNTIWRCNLNKKDCKQLYGDQDFWVQVLLAWMEVNYRNPQNQSQMLEEIIWLTLGAPALHSYENRHNHVRLKFHFFKSHFLP